MAASSPMRPGSGPTPLPGMPGPRHAPPGKVQRAKDTRGTIFRLWGYLSQQKMALIATACMVAVSVCLDVLGPYLLGRAIDGYIIPRDLPGLARIAGLMLVVNISVSLLNWGQSYIMTGAAQRTVRNIRNDLFGKLGSLPLSFFDSRSHGDLMSRLTNDVESINQVLSGSVTQIVSGLLSMIGITFIMLRINPLLAAVSLSTIAVVNLFVNRWIGKQTSAAFRAQQASLGALNGMVEETVGGQHVVKAYGQEEATIAKFEVANRELQKAATRAQTFGGYRGPIMNAIGNSALALVAGFGGVLALRGVSSVGTIASFINYTRQFSRPLNDIANLYNSILSAIAGAERVFEVIDQTPEIDAPQVRPLDTIRGDVKFEDVTFSYVPGTPILKHINLHAKPGQTIALIGPTGAGKTTIINLLTRFYEIDSGRITIDGCDIRELPKSDLRRQLGIVLQDTFLFAGTVKENIRYGRLDATEEEIVAAAKLANAHSFIHRLPQGYDTPLSERGSNISHGQRQLLAIARALLANPSILILDEATSSVDTRTEKHIQEAMLRLMEGRTSFVIAHRLSTIREADQILVISSGEIIERGKHTELLEQNGFYARLSQGQPEIGAETPTAVENSH